MVFKHPHHHQTPPQVENEFPPAAALEGAVSDALAGDGALDATDVAVTATGSVITLRGTVLREEEVGRAEEVALGVEGVSEVRNELKATGELQSPRGL
jgi:hypothetical protein